LSDHLSSLKLTFLPAGRSITISAGTTILEAAREAGIHINSSCGGSGLCGKCRVRIESGEFSEEGSPRLSQKERQEGIHLACRTRISSNAEVRIAAEAGIISGGLTTGIKERRKASLYTFDIASLQKAGVFRPPVEKLFIELPRPGAHDNMADAGRLLASLASQYDEHGLIISLAVLRKLRRVLREDDFRVTVTIARPVRIGGRSYILNIQPGNWTRRNYGMVFDIGTTTVYGQIIDLASGEVLAEEGEYNGQIAYGEDVISRMIQAEKPGGLQMMGEVVCETMNRAIAAMQKKSGISREEISSLTVAGNTTMSHLFLELETDNIRRSPYVPVSTFLPPMRAADLGLDLQPHTVALVFPAVSSYVGGDIVAGVMGSGMYRDPEITLFLDIGTNAEIVIGNEEWLACAACSAGPAFEGGGITCGMRAGNGAISDFTVNPADLEPMNTTIGNKPVAGICGSGLLMIVAALFRHRIIGPDGKFNRELESHRLRAGENGFEFVLAFAEETGVDHDVVINEVDIDNFLRAKAAIFAGVVTLLEQVGLAIKDLDRVILAGAFGSFIDIDAAMTVGLLPPLDAEKVMYVGNGPLMGGRMNELSNHIRMEVVEAVNRMTSFELSEVPNFKDNYLAALFLPHTDRSIFPPDP